MKQFLLVTLLTTIMLTSCSKPQAVRAQTTSQTLVTYFSATGTTKAVAQRLAQVADADLWEIAPAQAYTSADLDWRDKSSRSSLEMNDDTARPTLKSTKADIARYDTIYIGFPIWWYVAPRIINSFIEAHDLAGKVLIPFATSGGSPIGPCVDALRKSYPGLQWHDGRLLNRASEQALRQWVKGQ